MQHKIFYLSDIHLECLVPQKGNVSFETFVARTTHMLPEGDTRNDILVLAGDIFNGTKSLMWGGHSWMKHVAEKFCHVIVVLGNHDYWHNVLSVLPIKYQRMLDSLPNVSFLHNGDWASVGDIAFIGGTLWTDMDKDSPIAVTAAPTLMNDYRYIRDGNYIKIRAHQTLTEHHKTRGSLFYLCKQFEALGNKIVVVTHHAPTFKSCEDSFRGHASNVYYASDMSEDILDRKIDVWIHGHTHSSCEYSVGETLVLCNPFGYSGSNVKFDRNKHIVL